MYDRDDEVEYTFEPEDFSEFEAYLYAPQGKVSVRSEVPRESQEARRCQARPRQQLHLSLLLPARLKTRLHQGR
jgi:hypothetical protein